MKTFFQSPIPYVGYLLLPTFILVTLGVGLFTNPKGGSIPGGLFLFAVLLALYGFAFDQLRKPMVTIDGNRIEVRGYFGKVRHVEDVRDYQLVLAGRWIGFRRKGEQDIMVGKAKFSKKNWADLKTNVKSLPFSGIV